MTDLSQAYGSLINEQQPEPAVRVREVPIASPVPDEAYEKSLREQNMAMMLRQQQQQMIPTLQPITNQQKMMAQQQQQQQQIDQDRPSYLDKMFSKKRELWKAVQIALIIMLALSLHFIIDHYMKMYFNNNTLSFERDLVMRLLYPIAVLFVLWNLKAFMK